MVVVVCIEDHYHRIIKVIISLLLVIRASMWYYIEVECSVRSCGDLYRRY